MSSGRVQGRVVSGGSVVFQLPNATRVATNVACKINCVTDQKKSESEAKQRKAKKKTKKFIYFLFGQTKVTLVTPLRRGREGGVGFAFCRQFAISGEQAAGARTQQCPEDMQLTYKYV